MLSYERTSKTMQLLFSGKRRPTSNVVFLASCIFEK